MFEHLIQLMILFFVIFDPPASFVVFFSSTKKMSIIQRRNIAFLAVAVAGLLSFIFLVFGQSLLTWFNTDLNDFKVAGGIILILLGVKMSLGQSLANGDDIKEGSGKAIASIIGTPLLTGPAAISAIIMSTSDYGILETGAAIFTILFLTGVAFSQSYKLNKFIGKTAIQVMSTIMGLITLAWGVQFIRAGLGV